MSRIFEEFPEQTTCPICNSNKQGQCVLVPVAGTDEGYTAEAAVIHLDCLLEYVWYYPKDISDTRQDVLMAVPHQDFDWATYKARVDNSKLTGGEEDE